MRTAEELSRTISGGNSLAQLFVENVAYQESAVETLKSRGLPTEGVPVYGRDKHARLASKSHLVQGKKVLFPEHGCEDLIQQLVGFGQEKYKDLADAFAILLQKVDEKNVHTNGFIQMIQPDLKKMRSVETDKPNCLARWVTMARLQGGQ
jgi:phage terminase large subunit-like protein